MAIERIVPGTKEWDAYYANHIVRYKFAAAQIKGNGQKILDAACGVGYGSHFISTKGIGKITAIDRSEEALAIAVKNFSNTDILFLKDDCHTLSGAQKYGPFHSIISFETLEHLPKPADFLNACYKNLEQNGTIIISTPNIYVSSPDGIVNWEYHEKEYTPDEFQYLLQQSGFSGIRLFGQQLNKMGKLKEEFRAELNRLNSNPFIRLGKIIQKVLKGHKDKAILPESESDFDIVEYTGNITAIKELGIDGPFVLIAVATK